MFESINETDNTLQNHLDALAYRVRSFVEDAEAQETMQFEINEIRAHLDEIFTALKTSRFANESLEDQASNLAKAVEYHAGAQRDLQNQVDSLSEALAEYEEGVEEDESDENWWEEGVNPPYFGNVDDDEDEEM